VISGEEIIQRLEVIKGLIDSDSPDDAQLKINYLIDDIFLYKKNVL